MRAFRNLMLTMVSSAALAACAQPNGRPELAFSQPAEAEIRTVNLDELQALPHSGCVLQARVDVAGLPANFFVD